MAYDRMKNYTRSTPNGILQSNRTGLWWQIHRIVQPQGKQPCWWQVSSNIIQDNGGHHHELPKWIDVA